MKNIFNSILVLLICFYPFNLFAQKNASIYVSPHPDDWQLFMNPNAYHSVKDSNEKVVFIHTTAGDAGAGISNNNYYLAREEGSLRAIRFMSNTFTSGTGLGANMNETIVNINGHNILKYTYRNSTVYFLRLPDGNVDGSGYVLHNYKSLQRLYNGTISNITAVDNTTTYGSLTDLRNTLKSIIELESVNVNKVILNLADDNSSINPGDHSDHIYSSKIMQDVANSIGGISLNLYSDYDTGSRAQNVFNDDYLVSAGTWGATASGLSDRFHSSTWDETHNKWIGKQYFRTVLYPASNSNIALNKPTSASSNETNSPSSEANDNNYSINNNYWGASPYPQWWQVDLKDVYDVNKIVITNYYDGTRYYQYDIQASTNGINWTKIVDFNNNKVAANNLGNTFGSLNTKARYLRVNMNFNSANIGVHIVEFEAYGELANVNTTNIALNKPTSASSNETNSPSSEANDNNYSINNNYWGASPYSQWWQVDLKDVYDVNKIVIINYYDGTRYYQYDIQASTNGINWTKIVDFNNNKVAANNQGNTFGSLNTKARYLRVNMNFNSANIGVHIVEFEAYGELANVNTTNIALNKSTDSSSNEKLNGTLIYPNPVDKGDNLKIELDYPFSGTLFLQVNNLKGTSIISKTIEQTKISNIINVDTSDFTIGLNIVNLTIMGKTISKKVYVK